MNLSEIRDMAKELTIKVDKFILEAEEMIKLQQAEYSKKMKKVKEIELREKDIKVQEESLASERKVLKKEKIGLREKKENLKLEESRLKKQADRIQKIVAR